MASNKREAEALKTKGVVRWGQLRRPRWVDVARCVALPVQRARSPRSPVWAPPIITDAGRLANSVAGRQAAMHHHPVLTAFPSSRW
eukprot:ctg_505.g184